MKEMHPSISGVVKEEPIAKGRELLRGGWGGEAGGGEDHTYYSKVLFFLINSTHPLYIW